MDTQLLLILFLARNPEISMQGKVAILTKLQFDFHLENPWKNISELEEDLNELIDEGFAEDNYRITKSGISLIKESKVFNFIKNEFPEIS